jgi:hypothetical protein
MGGQLELTRLLIERGANLAATHKHGGNALGRAIYCAVNFRNPMATTLASWLCCSTPA